MDRSRCASVISVSSYNSLTTKTHMHKLIHMCSGSLVARVGKAVGDNCSLSHATMSPRSSCASVEWVKRLFGRRLRDESCRYDTDCVSSMIGMSGSDAVSGNGGVGGFLKAAEIPSIVQIWASISTRTMNYWMTALSPLHDSVLLSFDRLNCHCVSAACVSAVSVSTGGCGLELLESATMNSDV